MDKFTFTDRLNQAFAQSRYSQAQLAKLVGTTRASIHDYLSGRSQPKTERLTQIAHILNVNPNWLLGSAKQQRLGENLLTADIYLDDHPLTVKERAMCIALIRAYRQN